MEELMDFDEWLKNYKPKEPEYVAVFDPQTGHVKSVGPLHAFENEKNKISVDRETAESIISGEINISSCVIDFDSNVLEIAEIKNIFKIDDVLHRIISKEWSTVENPDVFLTYDLTENTLTIELSEELGGTHKIEEKHHPIKSRKIIWDGDIEMDFLITDYNDPNLLYELVSVKINELVGNSKVINDIKYDVFSVYTRRIFKSYIIEHK